MSTQTSFDEQFNNSTKIILPFSGKHCPHTKTTSGHLFTGPTITALNKHTFSSIPSAVETLLFPKPKNLHIQPTDNLGIFTRSGDNILKTSFLTSTCHQLKSSSSLLSSSSSSSKKNKKSKRKITIPKRFDYTSLENSKYLPGPADYVPKTRNTNNIPLFGSGRKDNTVGSMYYNWNSCYNVGPGSYETDISSFSNEYNCLGCYISPNERFRKEKIDEDKIKVGPGSYEAVNGGVHVKEKDKTSFFFKKGSHNKKYNTNNESYNEPGPGSYNVESGFNKKNISHNVKRSFGDIRKELMKKEQSKYNNAQEILKQMTMNANIRNKEQYEHKPQKFNPFKLEEDLLKYKVNKYGHVMNSKTPRFSNALSSSLSSSSNHVPGPCYYKPIKNIRRSFNSNINSNWI